MMDDNIGVSARERSALTELVQRVAAQQLRESDSGRKQSMELFNKWIVQNTNITNIRTDDEFLLRFLRSKKMSVPMAQQMLLKWLNLRNRFPTMCKELDCNTSSLSTIIDAGYLIVSPRRDSHGRRLIIYNIGKFDPMKGHYSDMARMHFLAYETLLEEPCNQVLGFVHVVNMAGVGGAHVTCWPPADFARILKWGEQSMPMRHKEIHLLNVPKTMQYVYEFAKSRMSQKINGRMMLHADKSSLLKKIEKECLPKELGGLMETSEMISLWKKELSEKRNTVLSLDKMTILDASDINPYKQQDGNNNGKNSHLYLPGSFRKLEVD